MEQAKVIKMTYSPDLNTINLDTKGSCGSGGCSIQPYILPYVEIRPWDGNRHFTIRKAA